MLLVLLKVVFLGVKLILAVAEVLASLVDQFIATARIFDGFLPLEVKLVTFLVEAFEFLSRLVELNLSGLGLSDLLLELLAFVADLDCQLLNLEGKLLNFGLVSTTVLLESEVVFFLLTGGESPLLQLFLIPVHLEFELVHALVSLENHILDIVEAILLVGDTLLKLLNFVFEAA